MPPEFSVSGNWTGGLLSLAPGESTSLVIAVDTMSPASHSAVLTIQSNDTDEANLDLLLTADVVATADVFTAHDPTSPLDSSSWRTLDSHFDYLSLTERGLGAPAALSEYEGGSIGDEPAVWDFASLPTGQYRVYATWPTPDRSDRTYEAAYSLHDGAYDGIDTARQTRIVNQRIHPLDAEFEGVGWAELGTVDVSSGLLSVALHRPSPVFTTNENTSAAIADAVRIVRVDSPNPSDDVIRLASGRSTYVIDVTANDGQPDLPVVLVDGADPLLGLTTVENNQIVFTPLIDQIGKDLEAEILYQLDNNGTLTNTAKVTLRLSDTEPIVVNDSYTTSQRHDLTVDPRINDIDPQGDRLDIDFRSVDDGRLVSDGQGGYSIDLVDEFFIVLDTVQKTDTWSLSLRSGSEQTATLIGEFKADDARDDTGVRVETKVEDELRLRFPADPGDPEVTVQYIQPRVGQDRFQTIVHQLKITGLPRDAGLVVEAEATGSQPVNGAVAVQDKGHLTKNDDGTWVFSPNYSFYQVAGDYRVDLHYVASDGVHESQEQALVTIRVENTAPVLEAPEKVLIAYEIGGAPTQVQFPLDVADNDGDKLFVLTLVNGASNNSSLNFGAFGSKEIINDSVLLTLTIPPSSNNTKNRMTNTTTSPMVLPQQDCIHQFHSAYTRRQHSGSWISPRSA
ncbi:MAG: hypothetical protein R3C02_18785 [Planctomycetaceae bacterium]